MDNVRLIAAIKNQNGGVPGRKKINAVMFNVSNKRAWCQRSKRGRDITPNTIAMGAQLERSMYEPAPDVEFALLDAEVADRLPELFAAMPRLRVIQALTASVDWLVPRVPQGVIVCRAVGVHDRAVSEWVVAAILAMQRRFPTFFEAQRNGRWHRDEAPTFPDDDLEGQTVLVLGYGSIGRTLVSRLARQEVLAAQAGHHPVVLPMTVTAPAPSP